MQYKQKNFRMSCDAIELLTKTAARLDCTETDLLEMCIATHATQIAVEAERASALLTLRLTKQLATRPKVF